MTSSNDSVEAPIILCGLGQVGRHVLEHLLAAGLPVVVVDRAPIPDQYATGPVRWVQGDFRERLTLQKAGIASARGVLILTGDDLINISAVLLVRHLNPQVRVVVRFFNQNLIPRMGKAVANVVALSVSQLSAPMLALTAMTGEVIGAFPFDEDRRLIAELLVSDQSGLRDQTIAAVSARHQLHVLSVRSSSGDEQRLLNVQPATRLAPGDRLVVCGDPRDVGPLLQGSAGESLPNLRWAGWARRHGRALGRTLREIDLPVKICTSILLTVVVASTVVYYLFMNKSLAQGLFRTIRVIASGADLHEGELPAEWQKVFVSILRVAGAALIAAFTAILTNYLLRARLRGALEIRRIPDGGHVIVCGLGNIGFRLVEELVKHGERVVVIEMQREGRFMEAARRKNVAVMIGDATVLEVLRQAHAASARAVVAATNHELVNIEIALLARELNAHQRVVVRLDDTQLSEMLRESASIGLALSLPGLAAPAFLAALYGDRVLSVFLIRRRLMAVVELLVGAQDSALHGQSVRALSIDFALLPIRLQDAGGSARAHPLDHQLDLGDRLTVVTALSDLARLQRREKPPSCWGLEVTSVEIPARPAAKQLLRDRLGLDPAAAEAALDRLPLSIGNNLTQGHAEVLRAELHREGIACRRVHQPS